MLRGPEAPGPGPGDRDNELLTDAELPAPAGRTFDPPLEDLVRRVAGPVLAGDDPRAAEEAATFNLAVTHRPAVVVGATRAEDVAAAVSWAVANHLPVAAQATGHGPVRAVEDALLVTTSRMQSVEIDADRRTAKVGAGVRCADVIAAVALAIILSISTRPCSHLMCSPLRY